MLKGLSVHVIPSDGMRHVRDIPVSVAEEGTHQSFRLITHSSLRHANPCPKGTWRPLLAVRRESKDIGIKSTPWRKVPLPSRLSQSLSLHFKPWLSVTPLEVVNAMIL